VTVAVGADHRGYALKESLKRWLAAHGHRVLDCGCDGPDRADYPDHAFLVARAVQRGRAARGLLVCSTGIGMSIAANRLPRVRAALCRDVRLARLSRQHNDSNVLCLGADYVTPAVARRILAAWLDEKFAGGRHARRVRMLGSVRC
jgi:ribose 5-phosphate isomerase B